MTLIIRSRLRPGRSFTEEMEKPGEDQLVICIMLHPDVDRRHTRCAFQIAIRTRELFESLAITLLEIIRTNSYEFLQRLGLRHRSFDIRICK